MSVGLSLFFFFLFLEFKFEPEPERDRACPCSVAPGFQAPAVEILVLWHVITGLS